MLEKGRTHFALLAPAKVHTLNTMENKILVQIFGYLNPAESTSAGLACKSLHNVHKKFHRRVSLYEYTTPTYRPWNFAKVRGHTNPLPHSGFSLAWMLKEWAAAAGFVYDSRFCTPNKYMEVEKYYYLSYRVPGYRGYDADWVRIDKW